jgi:hypothetical protein
MGLDVASEGVLRRTFVERLSEAAGIVRKSSTEGGSARRRPRLAFQVRFAERETEVF